MPYVITSHNCYCKSHQSQYFNNKHAQDNKRDQWCQSYIFKNSVKNIKANHQNTNFLVLSLFSIPLRHFLLTDYIPVLT